MLPKRLSRGHAQRAQLPHEAVDLRLQAADGGRVGFDGGGDVGIFESILGDNIVDQVQRGFITLLGGGNLLGTSMNEYDDAYDQLKEMGESHEDIIGTIGERPELIGKADGGRVGLAEGGDPTMTLAQKKVEPIIQFPGIMDPGGIGSIQMPNNNNPMSQIQNTVNSAIDNMQGSLNQNLQNSFKTETVDAIVPNDQQTNIGGGFPTIYPDLIPQSLETYFKEIKKGLDDLDLEKLPEIICEPGRAIVAESGSTIVKVNLRKKQKLYINDGTYGTLFDAGVPNIVYPSRLITSGRIISKKLTSFDFFGPTCDSMDYMKGPFVLPNNIKENDYIELGQLGAYGLTFRTQFNGFYSDNIFEVEDDPIMTMYNKEALKEFLVA